MEYKELFSTLAAFCGRRCSNSFVSIGERVCAGVMCHIFIINFMLEHKNAFRREGVAWSHYITVFYLLSFDG